MRFTVPISGTPRVEPDFAARFHHKSIASKLYGKTKKPDRLVTYLALLYYFDYSRLRRNSLLFANFIFSMLAIACRNFNTLALLTSLFPNREYVAR